MGKPIRLVESKVSRTGDAAEEPPVKSKPVRIGNPRAGLDLARVTMLDSLGGDEAQHGFSDNRLALLAPTGTSYRFTVALPSVAPYLEVGLGYLHDNSESSADVRFEVVVESSGGRDVALDTVVAVRKDGHFDDRDVDLGKWAGEDVTLVLSTQALTPEVSTWSAWAAPEIVSREGREEGWDVILISLDTLRADHLSCYGHNRPTSPAIDRLGERSVRFDRAVSASPWTRPAHKSLFSGLYPIARQGLRSLPLAIHLWRAGYRTVAATGGGQIRPDFGFAAGFESYRTEDWLPADGDGIVRLWNRARGRKQFLFLHSYAIHDPYLHHRFTDGMPRGRVGESFSKRTDNSRLKPLTPEEKIYVEALYDGGIAYADEQLGKVLDKLDDAGALERAIVILTSDHGEQFWEHNGWGHGFTMYDHQLLVPLIVYLPPDLRRELGVDALGEGSVIAQQVRSIDLYPTILDLLGVDLPHRVQGMSLRPLLEGGSMPDIEAFSESTNIPRERKSLRSDSLKLVRVSGKKKWDEEGPAPSWELYDLRRDPREQHNLASDYPDIVEFLSARMLQIMHGSDESERAVEVPDDIDDRLREELAALGYL